MKSLKRELTFFFLMMLVIAVCVSFPLSAIASEEINDSSLAYCITPKLTEATYSYLNDYYIEKYPELGLDFLLGSTADQAAIRKMADILTEGCKSEKEKVSAIVNWVEDNIEYHSITENISCQPIDVFYTRKGNCQGQADLVKEMLKMEGIPAVSCCGFVGDMKEVFTLSMTKDSIGHAWLMVFYDNDWYLYDPAFKENGVNDRDYISKRYFTTIIEGVSPYYDGIPYEYINNGMNFFCIDGRIMQYCKGVPSSEYYNMNSEQGIELNGKLYGAKSKFDDGNTHDGFEYVSNPSRKESMINDECYRDGFIKYGTSMVYALPNGILATRQFVKDEDKSYFCSFDGNLLEVECNNDNYITENGYILIHKGIDELRLIPAWYESEIEQGRYIWCESMNPDVAQIDDQFNIIPITEGFAQFFVCSRDDANPSSEGNYYYSGYIQVIITEDDYRTYDYIISNSGKNWIQDTDDFVTRCYSLALGREPDEIGFNDWKGFLSEGKMVGSTVVYDFIFSPEYLVQNKTDEEFVNDLYTMFLGRPADQGGYDSWCELINQGWSREDVFAGFANSTEFNGLCSGYGISAGFYTNKYSLEQVNNINLFVERLYKTCLSRLGDQGGQKDWVEGMLNGTYTGVECAINFIKSDEYTNLGLSNEQYVENLYVGFMGRTFDEAGKTAWLELLRSGAMTRDQVLEGFANSVEFEEICANYGIERGSYTATNVVE